MPSLSSGHCGCLLSSFLGKLGLGTISKSVAAVVELPCKQSILLVATRKFFATSIPHFLFTCEIYRLETFIPSLCSATYFFISSYVALVSADVISTSSSSIVDINIIIRLLFQLGQKNNSLNGCNIFPQSIHDLFTYWKCVLYLFYRILSLFPCFLWMKVYFR